RSPGEVSGLAQGEEAFLAWRQSHLGIPCGSAVTLREARTDSPHPSGVRCLQGYRRQALEEPSGRRAGCDQVEHLSASHLIHCCRGESMILHSHLIHQFTYSLPPAATVYHG